MGTIIILAILLIIIIAAINSSVKHVKGEGGCCGGESDSPEKVKKQKLKQIVETKRIKIEGMQCDHCRKTVENALNTLSQVNARVNLKKKEAIVHLGTDIPDTELKKAVEEKGYQVIAIEKVSAGN